jgi:hypothetical protein
MPAKLLRSNKISGALSRAMTSNEAFIERKTFLGGLVFQASGLKRLITWVIFRVNLKLKKDRKKVCGLFHEQTRKLRYRICILSLERMEEMEEREKFVETFEVD